MKKVFLAVLAIIATTFTADAQKVNAAKVPIAVKTSFAKQFRGASAQWEKEGTKYEAGFLVKGNAMSAVFDAKGVLEETETGIKQGELPSKVLSYLKDHYKGKNIEEKAKITKADGTITYEVGVGGKEVIFDSAGNFLKEAKD
ncbi:MAG: PepSY-like domain-containing protein [Ferruginibacter sp.]